MNKEGQHKHFDNRFTKIAWLSISLLIILCLVILPDTTAQAQEEIEVPEGTIPTIDGVIAPGEWDDALKVEGPLPWRALYLKHDDENLYAGFEATGYIDEFYFVFDPRGKGVSFDEGEDTKRCFESICDDCFYIRKFGIAYDEQQDVEGAGFYNEETDITTYELSMPLISRDPGGNDPDVWLSLMVAGLVQQAQEHMILNGGGGVKLKPKPPPPPALTKEYFKTKYGITLVDRDEKWSEEEKKWLDELLRILPESFLREKTLRTIERQKGGPGQAGRYNRKDKIVIYDDAEMPYHFRGKFKDADKVREWEFKSAVLHELTHHRQYEWPRYVEPKMNPTYKDAYQNPWMKSYITAINTDPKTGKPKKNWVRNPITGKWKFDGDKGRLVTEYAWKKNPKEDMAESAKFYVYDPKVLKEKSPTRYEWLKTNLFGGKEYENGKIKEVKKK